METRPYKPARIAGRERLVEGVDMRASILTLAAGESIPWHYYSEITDYFVCLEGPMLVETRAPRAEHLLQPGLSASSVTESTPPGKASTR